MSSDVQMLILTPDSSPASAGKRSYDSSPLSSPIGRMAQMVLGSPEARKKQVIETDSDLSDSDVDSDSSFDEFVAQRDTAKLQTYFKANSKSVLSKSKDELDFMDKDEDKKFLTEEVKKYYSSVFQNLVDFQRETEAFDHFVKAKKHGFDLKDCIKESSIIQECYALAYDDKGEFARAMRKDDAKKIVDVFIKSSAQVTLEAFIRQEMTKAKALYPNLVSIAKLESALYYFSTLMQNLPEKQTPDPKEIFVVAFYITSQKNVQKPQYVAEIESGTKRALIFDKYAFYVLSGNKSRLFVRGAEREVSSALRIRQRTNALDVDVLARTRTFLASEKEADRVERQVNVARMLSSDIAVSLQHSESGKLFLTTVETQYESDLEKYCRSEKLAQKEIVVIMKKVAQNLLELHENGYVHGDINPRNILISIKEQTVCAKLTDLGMTYDKESIRMLTPLKTAYGSTEYTAPEYIEKNHGGKKIKNGQAHDMYALGCVLYELLFQKKVPWLPTLLQALNKKDETLLTNYGGIESSDPLTSICVDLLAKDPKKRLTVDALLKRLATIS